MISEFWSNHSKDLLLGFRIWKVILSFDLLGNSFSFTGLDFIDGGFIGILGFLSFVFDH